MHAFTDYWESSFSTNIIQYSDQTEAVSNMWYIVHMYVRTYVLNMPKFISGENTAYTYICAKK